MARVDYKGTVRRFKDESARLIVANKLIAVEVTIYYFLAIFFSIIEISRKSFGALPYVVIVTSIAFLVYSWVMYNKVADSPRYCYPVLIMFYIVYLVVLTFMDEQLTLFFSVVILTALIVRYNKKLIKTFAPVAVFVLFSIAYINF